MATSQFIGREDEKRGLIARLRTPNTTTLVLGEAGIGKSRLLREVGDELSHPVFRGRAWSGAVSTPYLPWMQIAVGLAGVTDPRTAEHKARFSDVAALFDANAGTPRFRDDETSRHLLAISLSDYLGEVAERSGGLISLVTDDAHAADPHSLELLTRIVGQQLPLSVVVASRPFNEARPDAQPRLAELYGQSEMLALSPLGPVAAAELLKGHGLGDEHLDDALAATAGVPLLLHNWLAETGPAGVSPTTPGIHRRLAAMSASTVDLLRYCAVVADDFDVATLHKASGMPVEGCLQSLAEAEAAGFIDRSEGLISSYSFHHDTFREQVLAGIDPAELAERHRTLLQVFTAARGTAADRGISQLAEHASHAAFGGDAELAVDLNLEAAESALARSAPLIARHHFERAVELAAMAGSPRRIRLAAELGSLKASKSTGRTDVTAGLISFLGTCDDDPEINELFAEAALLLSTGSGGMGVAPDVQPEVRLWVTRALQRLSDEPSPLRCRLLIELGIQSRDGSEDEISVPLDESSRIASLLEDHHLRSLAFTADRWIRRTPGEGPSVLGRIAELEADLDHDDFDSRVWLSGLRITTLLRMGETAAATREMNRLQHALWPVPPMVQWLLHRARSVCQFLAGDLEAAEASAVAAYEAVAGGHHDNVATEFFQMQLSSILRVRSNSEAVEPVVAQMVSERPQFLPYRAAYAWVLADVGRKDEARQHLAHVFASSWGENSNIEWLPLASLAINAAAALEEEEWCRRGVELFEPYRDEWILYGTSNVCEGPVSLRRGRAATVAGDLETARADLEHAREAISRANARIFEPELLYFDSRLKEAEGDLEGALATLTAASLSASALGLDQVAATFAGRAFQLDEERGAGPTSSHASRTAPATRNPEDPLTGTFVRQGATWKVGLGAEQATVRHVKGMSALAVLIDRPGREIPARQLASIVDGTTRGHTGPLDPTEIDFGATEDLLIDDVAMAQYRDRISELQQTLEEAGSFNDLEREAGARRELDDLIEHLSTSTGLGGRSRTTTSSNERARVRMTKSIRTAISRISDVAPTLGSHLENSVRTGSYCRYRPDRLQEIAWARA